MGSPPLVCHHVSSRSAQDPDSLHSLQSVTPWPSNAAARAWRLGHTGCKRGRSAPMTAYVSRSKVRFFRVSYSVCLIKAAGFTRNMCLSVYTARHERLDTSQSGDCGQYRPNPMGEQSNKQLTAGYQDLKQLVPCNTTSAQSKQINLQYPPFTPSNRIIFFFPFPKFACNTLFPREFPDELNATVCEIPLTSTAQYLCDPSPFR